MFENVCAIPLDYDLFAQAIHPEEPIVAVGLASGHVQTYRLPGSAEDEVIADSKNGFGHIDTVWKTRRHKGSCRTLGWSVDGAQLYSAGTDGIVKVADAATGRVSAKIAVPLDAYVQADFSTLFLYITCIDTYSPQCQWRHRRTHSRPRPLPAVPDPRNRLLRAAHLRHPRSRPLLCTKAPGHPPPP